MGFQPGRKRRKPSTETIVLKSSQTGSSSQINLLGGLGLGRPVSFWKYFVSKRNRSCETPSRLETLLKLQIIC